jgi:hypothetical protein
VVRILPALLILSSSCTRFGFSSTPDAAAVPDPDPDLPITLESGVVDVDRDLPVDLPVDLPTADGGPSDLWEQTLAGSLQGAGSGPVFRLLFGMADNKFPPMPTAFIKELELDISTNKVVDRGYVTTNPGPLKALDVDGQGRLLLAHYRPAPFTLDIVELSPALKLSGSLSLSHAADSTRAIENTHALCFLPGGNFLVADGSNADDNHFNEYDPAGNLVRGVLTSKLANGKGTVISCCISRSDLEVYAHESEIDAFDGRMLRLTRPLTSSGWTVTDIVAVADVATKLGIDAPRTWAFALDQKNDQVYIAPYNPSTTVINRLIRCPAKGFSAASCVIVGDVIPGAKTQGGSVIKSLVQIPGTDDLLALNHGTGSDPESYKLYRFDAKQGTWTALFDLKQISGGYAQPQGYPVLR